MMGRPKPRGEGVLLAQKHRGAHKELIAAAWLLDKGYDVFRNVSAHGLADLIAWKPGESPILYDVKSAGEYISSTKGHRVSMAPLKHEQAKAGVLPLYVLFDGTVMLEPHQKDKNRPHKPK